jgi:hypothetical protein
MIVTLFTLRKSQKTIERLFCVTTPKTRSHTSKLEDKDEKSRAHMMEDKPPNKVK